ncbi:MAG TPA: hypothetical protein VE268_05925 [Herpetosiphonaceae bacterium]|nr:hypothetical protein [Herpetosiphonaceae bacterium]
MEYIIHEQPTADEPWTIYPERTAGNDACMFDQDGFSIADPVLSKMRGVDTNGWLVVLSNRQSQEKAAGGGDYRDRLLPGFAASCEDAP